MYQEAVKRVVRPDNQLPLTDPELMVYTTRFLTGLFYGDRGGGEGAKVGI